MSPRPVPELSTGAPAAQRSSAARAQTFLRDDGYFFSQSAPCHAPTTRRAPRVKFSSCFDHEMIVAGRDLSMETILRSVSATALSPFLSRELSTVMLPISHPRAAIPRSLRFCYTDAGAVDGFPPSMVRVFPRELIAETRNMLSHRHKDDFFKRPHEFCPTSSTAITVVTEAVATDYNFRLILLVSIATRRISYDTVGHSRSNGCGHALRQQGAAGPVVANRSGRDRRGCALPRRLRQPRASDHPLPAL